MRRRQATGLRTARPPALRAQTTAVRRRQATACCWRVLGEPRGRLRTLHRCRCAGEGLQDARWLTATARQQRTQHGALVRDACNASVQRHVECRPLTSLMPAWIRRSSSSSAVALDGALLGVRLSGAGSLAVDLANNPLLAICSMNARLSGSILCCCASWLALSCSCTESNGQGAQRCKHRLQTNSGLVTARHKQLNRPSEQQGPLCPRECSGLMLKPTHSKRVDTAALSIDSRAHCARAEAAERSPRWVTGGDRSHPVTHRGSDLQRHAAGCAKLVRPVSLSSPRDQ